MNDKTIITKFLSREFPDDHPTIYIYVCGHKRSEKTAIEKVMLITKQVFCPPFTEFFVYDIVLDYLNTKKTLYRKGVIKVKSFYD